MLISITVVSHLSMWHVLFWKKKYAHKTKPNYFWGKIAVNTWKCNSPDTGVTHFHQFMGFHCQQKMQINSVTDTQIIILVHFVGQLTWRINKNISWAQRRRRRSSEKNSLKRRRQIVANDLHISNGLVPPLKSQGYQVARNEEHKKYICIKITSIKTDLTTQPLNRRKAHTIVLILCFQFSLCL